MEVKKNRWLMALSAVGIHICIGSVYAWSVYTKPILAKMAHLDWNLFDVTLTFSIAITFLGLSAAVMGKFVERKGPRIAGMIAATLFGLGTFSAGFAILMESKYLLYISYGVIGGCGLGIGYITPVSTLVKWFPDKRGLATGLAIMGFGFASAISAPAIKILIDLVDISGTFFILGSVYFVIMFSSALYLERPPEGYLPEGFKEKIANGSKKMVLNLQDLTRDEAVKTPSILWTMDNAFY